MATNLVLLLGSFFSLPLLRGSKWPAVLVAIIVGLNLGLWRGQSVQNDLAKYDNIYGQEVSLKGKVSDDPNYGYRGQVEFHLEGLKLSNQDKLRGRIRVRSFEATGLRRGDLVRVEGRLYEGWGNRQGSISYASLEHLGRQSSWLESIRAKFFAGVYTALPEPNASLGLGYLVGLRTLLPESLLDQLSITGLTHIVAVSGYNLTILIRLTRRSLFKRSVFLSLASSFALIAGFMLITGLSPSIFRAAVIASLALLAWYFGRPVRPMVLILFGAAVTAMANPLYLWLDLGWHLSFAAFFGVLIFAPIVTARLFKTKPKLMGQIIIETTCAQIAALPIIVAVFSELSLISIIANAIILPLIPVAMLLTFVAGVGGMIGVSAAGWLAWPADQVLTFMTDSIAFMAKIPWSLMEIQGNWWQVSLFYLAILFLALVAWLKSKSRLNATEVIE